MNVLRIVSSGQISRQRRMRSSVSADARGPLHAPQDARAGVLERHVEVRQQLALGHQRDHVVDVRVRIDVVQPHPDAELAEPRTALMRVGTQPRQPRCVASRRRRRWCPARSPATPSRRRAPGARPRRSTSSIGRRHEVAAHRRDDAEAAAVVAALGDLQVRVVARRQLHALRRHQIEERIVRRRQVRRGSPTPPTRSPAVR